MLLTQIWTKRGSLRVLAAPTRLQWTFLASAFVAGLLFGGCAIPPGIMWSTEYGGYDVLEYHLELPPEWLENGAIVGFKHNAYSYLPDLFEAAYLHLGLWKRSVIEASYASHFLHAAMAVLTALLLGQVVAGTVKDGLEKLTQSGLSPVYADSFSSLQLYVVPQPMDRMSTNSLE